jgi:predicted TIM-barrel fold metal-dependent hydrolase
MTNNIPIIDAHHHIWRVQDGPMLSGPMQPRLFGDYTPIKRDYPMEEFREDVESSGVVNSIYVKAAWPFEKCVEEAAWVQSVFDETGWPRGIVAYADFSSEDVGSTLKQLTRFPNVKGIRQQLNWHINRPYRYVERSDLMKDPQWRRGFAKIQDHDLMFELQVFTSQMADAVEFVSAFPDVRFVLLHAGMLEDLSPEGREQWRQGLKSLAQQKNACIKLSGLGMFVHRCDPELIRYIITSCIEIFGADRCIYGSNFPIEKIWTDYRTFIKAYRAPLEHLSEKDQRAILHDNAVRIYHL